MKKQFNYNQILIVSLFLPCLLQAQVLRDPTQPKNHINNTVKGTDQTPKSALALQSIIIKKGTRKAIISGNIVSQGERIDGYLVEQISATSVVLIRGVEKLKLELYDYEIKR